MSKPENLIITDFTQPPDFPRLEEAIADFWDEQGIFARTLERTQAGPEYVFYDGPPFATGLPHYGHLVASTTKDLFPRYQTMRGRHVRRVWGWDCHGLPIENIIEKELNLPNRPAIMRYGVDNFCEACRSKVQLYTSEWQKTIRRLGRFIDMDHPYRTMDLSYMDRVWGVFHQLWAQGLIYKGYKVMYVCPRCATPLSNFEVTQGYKQVTDLSVYVKFALTAPADLGLTGPSYLIAWTTTPWTLPGNALLAVNKDLSYAVIEWSNEAGQTENLIMAESQVAEVMGEKKYRIINTLPGAELVGRVYQPPFAYLRDLPNAFRVCEADFVTSEEGTGIVHVAPPYGEDDFQLGAREGVPVTHHVTLTGNFEDWVTDFAGRPVKPADNPQASDIEIIKYLAGHGLLLAKKKIKHAYPHCWRCDTPLLNYATSSFFVKTTALRDELVANNQQIHWVPAHFKDGRFGQWLANVRDWAVSRNRFWGTPLPLWQSPDGDFLCVSNRVELERLSGQKVNDLHKNTVDKVKIELNGKTYTRVEEVFDCWFESGSMPEALGQFPADFVSEGQDQTRGWFYTLHVLATALHHQPAFRNVLVNGIILAADGKKMSKKLHNYPDPQAIFDRYGADALRLYLMTSPVMKAETLNFDEAEVGRLRRQVNVIWWNCYVFWRQTGATLADVPAETADWPLLDRWLWQRLQQLIRQVTRDLDGYLVVEAGRRLIDFVSDLSTFYLRLSRDRLKDHPTSQAVLGQTLLTLTKLFAPVMPFLSELLYQNLGGPEVSVHLEKWPAADTELDQPLLAQVSVLRDVLTTGHAARRALQIKSRQPLASLAITAPASALTALSNPEISQLVATELNVKKVNLKNSDEQVLIVEFDKNLTPELIAEGQARELMRTIAAARKQAGLRPDDDWEYAVSEVPADWQAEIERRTHTRLKVT